MTSSASRTARRRLRIPYPRRVGLWHFILLPTLGMGIVLLVSRVIDSLLDGRLGPRATDVFLASRTLVIALLMASLIAWLAVGYRRQYEAELLSRNLALEETRDFLSGIIEWSGEGIVTLDAAERVTSWNRAAERIFGWTAEEMLGQTVERVLPDDPVVVADRQRSEVRIRSGETVHNHRSTRVRKDGQHITVLITRSPLYDEDGRYNGSIGIVHDVTAEHAMEMRLREQERLAAVGELAAQVAHEIRNPLAGIRGACDLVFSGRAAAESRNEVAHEVLQQIDRLNRTVEELLQFAHPKHLEPVPTEIHDLIDRVLGVLEEDPRSSSVKVVRQYEADDSVADVDPGQIEQVLFNILLNAAQIMEFEGTITIHTEAANGEIKLCIRDTGPGIPADSQSQIFKPFYTTRARGTGLGLAIVRKIITAHRGDVEVSTGPEGGAEFCIRLPTSRADFAGELRT